MGRTKDGACDMVYKPEHVSDLESGAILRAEGSCGNADDTVDLAAGRLLAVHLNDRHAHVASDLRLTPTPPLLPPI